MFVDADGTDNIIGTEDDDLHLKSTVGRWDAVNKQWMVDGVDSPCIDAGDPAGDWSGELWPDGGRVNIGAYGNTAQASMSTSTAGKVADVDKDGWVNLIDLAAMSAVWGQEDLLQPANLDRAGEVELVDLKLLVDNWLWEE